MPKINCVSLTIRYEIVMSIFFYFNVYGLKVFEVIAYANLQTKVDIQLIISFRSSDQFDINYNY